MAEPIGYAARCSACEHEWWIIPTDQLPMLVGDAVRLMQRAECPSCGNDGRNGQPLYWITREPNSKPT